MNLPSKVDQTPRSKRRGRANLIAAFSALALMAGAVWALVWGDISGWVGPGRSDPAASSVAEKPNGVLFRMYLFYVYSDRGTCEVKITFTNRTTQVIDEFSADMVGTLDAGHREDSRFSVSYVDPGKSVDVTVKFFSRCDERAEFELRGAATCRSNGKYYRGCHKQLETDTWKTNWTLRNRLQD